VATEPPVLAGSVKLTVALPLPLVTATPVGVPGSGGSVTAAEAPDAAPVPMAFVAVTVNV
jgi:hypothetical protein